MSGYDEEVDWVVVGSGAGSMSSALVMRQAGKSVLILEKTSFIGGTTAKSGGVIWVPNNRFIKADGEQEANNHQAVLNKMQGGISTACRRMFERNRFRHANSPSLLSSRNTGVRQTVLGGCKARGGGNTYRRTDDSFGITTVIQSHRQVKSSALHRLDT